MDHRPKFDINYVAGTVLAKKMLMLGFDEHDFVDGEDNLRPSQTLTEFIVVTEMKLSLMRDPFKNALTILVDGSDTLCITRFKSATFFYMVKPSKIYLLDVIFDWDKSPCGQNTDCTATAVEKSQITQALKYIKKGDG